MTPTRITLGTAGVLLGSFGVYRLITQEPHDKVLDVVKWLAGALAIHDAIIAPTVVAVGWVIARLVPPRARRYAQAGLVIGALTTIIAIPLIYRRGSQPASKAILLRNYSGNLAILLGIIGGICLLAYTVQLIRHRSRMHGHRAASDPADHADTLPS